MKKATRRQLFLVVMTRGKLSQTIKSKAMQYFSPSAESTRNRNDVIDDALRGREQP